MKEFTLKCTPIDVQTVIKVSGSVCRGNVTNAIDISTHMSLSVVKKLSVVTNNNI